MRRENTLLAILYVLLLVLGCNRSKQSAIITEHVEYEGGALEVYYDNGNLQYVSAFDSVSGIRVRKWYYENTNLKKVQEYRNYGDSIELEYGTYVYYYPSGILKDSGQIVNGQFEGKRSEYHENGHLYTLITYINGKERNGIVYRTDGTLWKYKAFNYNEDLMFVIHYDSSGRKSEYIKNIKYKTGDLIYSWRQNDNYPLGKKFRVDLLVAAPPRCKTWVRVSDWDITRNRAINEKVYVPDEFNQVIYYRKQNPEKDLYLLNVASTRDTIEQTSMSDTLVIKIDKKGRSFNSRDFKTWK